MTGDWTPLCLVPACDLDAADWPMALAVVGADLSLRVEGATIQASDLHPRLVAAVSLSPAGKAILDRLELALAPSALSLDGLRHDLAAPGDLPAALVAGLSAALQQSQGRVVRQVRELAQMRLATERSLQSFERLEAFVWQTARAERNPTLHLAPRPDQALNLDTGAVEQRLPGDSTGLSDLAIWIGTAAVGQLTATLVLQESGQAVGLWQVTDPGAGWLRLALPRALSTDAQTPMLRLDWQGGEALTLGLSLDHPDPRFQCRGGPTLALRLWKFIPGTPAPMSPDSLASGPTGGRWLIGLTSLAEAAARLGDPARAEVVDWAGGLVLRPEPGETLALRLPGMACRGLRLVQAMAAVEGAGAAADLAFAVAAPGQPPEPATWQALTSQEPGQVHLHLPAPLAETADLVLIVRAREGAAPSVIFERIEGFANAAGRDD